MYNSVFKPLPFLGKDHLWILIKSAGMGVVPFPNVRNDGILCLTPDQTHIAQSAVTEMLGTPNKMQKI